MVDKLAIMAELNRRGALPPDKAALFAEAVKRGLVPGQTAQPGPSPAIKAGQDIAYAGQYDNQPPRPDLVSSIGATLQGITGSVPGLNQAGDFLTASGQTIGDIFANRPGTVSQHYADLQAQRNKIASQAPIAQTLGGMGGMMAMTAGLGAIPAGAEALGLSGSFGKQLLNSAGSTALYEGLQGLTHGHTGGQLLADEGIGGLSGLGGSLIGQGLNKAGEGISNALTKRAQNALTKTAIADAPAASDLFSAGSQLFDASTGGNPLQVTKDAYGRLLDTVQAATQDIRPNELTSKEGVGVLKKLVQVADEIGAPGANVAVDFKTLHVLRRSAQRVTQEAQATDESKAVAGIVVRKIDDFIKGLKPADIAGGADPKEAANALMKGISTWHKASKVSMIEDAIQAADTYKSGYENGLKLSFLKLMKTPDFQRFTPIEQDAIRTVAKGTAGQNIAEAFGKLGISFSGSAAHNVLGGGGAMLGLGTALSPALGPLAYPAALGITTATGAIGRNVAEKIAKGGANRAAQIMAADFIPVARQAPNLLGPVAVPAALAARSLPLAARG